MTEILDAQKKRQENFKQIIKDLHSGKDPEELKEKFASLLRQVSPTEISNMEDKLIREGMPEKEIKKLCDVHVAIFKDSLDKQKAPEMAAGHPVHTFRLENEAIRKVVTSIKELLKQADEKDIDNYSGALRSQLELLAEIGKHYLRLENQLFPLLERHEVYGPPKVMWQTHDDIRNLLKETVKELDKDSVNMESLKQKLKELLEAVEAMIYKEENILFPMSLDILNEEEWGEVRHGEEEIGYTLVTPSNEWRPPLKKANQTSDRSARNINLSTGSISAEQLDLLLTHLPLDITFVDDEDRVKYYSQGKERIFPRSPAIIGRKVQDCHPSDSVHVVNKIVNEFKSGSRDQAAFWLDMNNRKIFIRYYAVRNQHGEYQGVLEVTQDITDVQALKGQKRLLDW